jgi:hypothetical protein
MRRPSYRKLGTRVAAAISLHHTPRRRGFGPRVFALRHAISLGQAGVVSSPLPESNRWGIHSTGWKLLESSRRARVAHAPPAQIPR